MAVIMATNGEASAITQKLGPEVDTLVEIFVLGRTGDGKSTLSRRLAQHEGATNLAELESLFQVSSSAHSQTHDPVSMQVGRVKITDTPGLMDTSGTKRDEENVIKIAKTMRQAGQLSALFIVINAESPRFDAGMQEAFKLLVDSFGRKMLLQCTGLVFTRGSGDLAKVSGKAKEFTRKMLQLVGVSQEEELPYWQIDCHPEELAEKYKSPPEHIEQVKKAATKTLQEMVRWAKATTPCSTADVSPAKYTNTKLIETAKAAQAAAETAQRTAEQQRQQAETAQRAAEQQRQQAETARQQAEAAQRQAEETARAAARRAKEAEDRLRAAAAERERERLARLPEFPGTYRRSDGDTITIHADGRVHHFKDLDAAWLNRRDFNFTFGPGNHQQWRYEGDHYHQYGFEDGPHRHYYRV